MRNKDEIISGNRKQVVIDKNEYLRREKEERRKENIAIIRGQAEAAWKKSDARRRTRSRTGILGLNFGKSVRFG